MMENILGKNLSRPVRKEEKDCGWVVEYDSNNSGGSWWLTEEDWKKLEADKWIVEWRSKKHLGTNATKAKLYIKANSHEEAQEKAIERWENVLGMDASERGCDCCGQPHYFAVDEVEYKPGLQRSR